MNFALMVIIRVGTNVKVAERPGTASVLITAGMCFTESAAHVLFPFTILSGVQYVASSGRGLRAGQSPPAAPLIHQV